MKTRTRGMLLLIICLGFSLIAIVGSGCSDDAAQSANNGQLGTPDADSGSTEEDANSTDPDGGETHDVADTSDATGVQDGADDPDTAEEPDAADVSDANNETDASDGADATEPRACGGRAGDTCTDDEYCKFPEGTVCDFADGTGYCEPRPTDCAADEPEVCGCDGTTYRSACAARQGGTDVASDGACGGGTDPELCDAQDVSVSGLCDMVFGPFWTGNSCQYLSGCSCEGSDCDKAYESMEACETAHESCIDDCRTQGCDNPGDTCQLCWTSYLCLDEYTAC